MMSGRYSSLFTLLLVPSCSFVFTSGPPQAHERLPTFECSTNYAVPVLDGAWVGINLLLLTTAYLDDDPNSERNRELDLGLGVAFTVLGVAGMIVGYKRVSACKEARLQLYGRLGQEPRVAAVMPSPRSPGLTLQPQAVGSLERLTRPLTGSKVFITVEGARVNQMARELGRIYFHAKRDGGACDPRTASPWANVDSAKLEKDPPGAEHLALHLVKPETEAELSDLSRLNIRAHPGDVAIVEVRQATQSLVDDAALEAYLMALAGDPEGLDGCLYYIDRVTSYRLTAKVFRHQTARDGRGISGLNVAGTYYASDGSLQTAYGFLYGVTIFKLAVDGEKPRLVRRSLSPKEARAFEAALASAEGRPSAQ